jgi:hypothetical protein
VDGGWLQQEAGDPVPHRIAAALVGNPMAHTSVVGAMQRVARGSLIFRRYGSRRAGCSAHRSMSSASTWPSISHFGAADALSCECSRIVCGAGPRADLGERSNRSRRRHARPPDIRSERRRHLLPNARRDDRRCHRRLSGPGRCGCARAESLDCLRRRRGGHRRAGLAPTSLGGLAVRQDDVGPPPGGASVGGRSD